MHEMNDKPNEEKGARPIKDVLAKAMNRIAARVAKEEKPVPLPDAWKTLSEKIGGGLWNGCYFLVGNTSSGKTGFAMQLAYNAAKQGCPVLYIDMEGDSLDTAARVMSLHKPEHQWSWSDLFFGRNIKDKDLKALRGLCGEVDIPFHLFAGYPGLEYEKIPELAASVLEKATNTKPALIVLDYLQLFGSENNEDVRLCVRGAAYKARQLVRDKKNAVVLSITSTARNYYDLLSGKPDKDGKARLPDKPEHLVGLGKESGEIEYAANGVFVLCKLPGGETKLAVAKLRAGQPTYVPMNFDGARGIFTTEEKATKTSANSMLPLTPERLRNKRE